LLVNKLDAQCTQRQNRSLSFRMQGRKIGLNLSRDNTHINPLLQNDL